MMKHVLLVFVSELLFLPQTVWCELVITPSGPHIVVPKSGKLELRCYENRTMSGAPPSGTLRWWHRVGAHSLKEEVEEGGAVYVKVLSAQAYHMGRYICVNNSTLEYKSIYVYVKDPQNIFQRTIVNSILVRAGKNCTIPCLVTDPNVTHLALETCDGRPLPSGMSYRGNLQQGIIINNAQKEFEGCYICVGRLAGEKVVSGRYTVNAPTELPPVMTLSETDTILRKGEHFQVTCRASNVNSNFSLKWNFPQTAHPREFHTSHIHPFSHVYQRSASLLIPSVNQSHSGTYRCDARNQRGTTSMALHLGVRGKPIITAQEGPVEGQVRCIASGYPVPKISWYFCELPHTRCSHLPNASQWEASKVESDFGRSEVESRLNVTKEHAHYHTLECVASSEGDEAYTLFSISVPHKTKQVVPHKLLTPALTGMAATGIILGIILGVLLYKYMQKPKFQIQWKVIESIHGNNYSQIDPAQFPYDSKWEFPRQKLHFGETLGSGAFGKVVKATAYGLCSADTTVSTVAVKMLEPNAHSIEQEALMSELKILGYLGNHMNIVNLLGACTVGGPDFVITEYCCYGDLLHFLQRKRKSFPSSQISFYCFNQMEAVRCMEVTGSGYMPMSPSEKDRASQSGDIDELTLDHDDLLSISYQVAKGMEYITSKNCIHRDIAARNVLLTHGKVAKICDFGLARDISTDSSYVLRGNTRLPVKWMSPESIFYGVNTFQSEVWSYGILLWEIFSLGNSPYPGIQVGPAFYRMMREGYRMSWPEFATIEIYDIMLSCWNQDPLKRPSFQNLVQSTELLLSENTRNVYLTTSSVPGPPGQQMESSRSSVCSTTATLSV